VTSLSSGPREALELLAPAGNWECAKAAIENGADAIYFGLQVGFNARARADNFQLDELPKVMDSLHERDVRGYVTLNTLVFTDELRAFENNVRRLIAAGVDAVLVQDIGAVRLIRDISPDFPVHASTQMTMTSSETIQAIEELGIQRVVLAREISIDEIRLIRANTSMPLECFVHGALCVAYSGQCLTSESLGGRSANRGQCAQACRLDYKMHVKAQPNDDGSPIEIPAHPVASQYYLSPQDLAAHDYIPQLIQAGITSFKIEGRLKTPEYVANTVGHYRQAIDQSLHGQPCRLSDEDQRELELSFSRGFSPGWLDGCNHKRLVPGLSSAKRGVLVGRVVGLKGERLSVELTHPISKGDGVVLAGNRAKDEEIGGRVYEIFRNGRPVEEATAGRVEWLFQKGLLKNAKVYPGQEIWQTDDPRLAKKLRATFASSQPVFQKSIRLSIFAKVHQPLKVIVEMNDRRLELLGDEPLSEAVQHAVTEELFRQQFSRLGGTPFKLDLLTATIEGQPMVPFSQLGVMRKRLVEKLKVSLLNNPHREVVSESAIDRSFERIATFRSEGMAFDSSELSVLCRSLSQLKAILAAEESPSLIYADFQDIREYRQAVEWSQAAGKKIYLATLRIHKPGEQGLFLALAKNAADGWLVRNLAALSFAKQKAIPFVGDFSLNVTNPLTAEWLINQGAERVTASYDLNRDQLQELVQASPTHWLEVVIHQHIPMFHMEHCVFCTVLSPGINKSNCGRPCDRLDVQLEDRIGVRHVLHADIGCRNTLYNGTAQSGAEAVAGLQRSGVRKFRIELLRDASTKEIQRLIKLYRDLLAGRITGSEVWRSLKADNRVGVTRGTLEQPRNPLAVL
jgi:U32 family peptidase